MKPFNAKYNAFSLVEMLVALLVASLLMAALAPVMTRKMNENIKVSGLGATYKAPADLQCFSYNDSQPTVDVSLNDVYSASFIIASGGGGGAGATSSKKIAANPVQITGTTGGDSTQEITITEYMADVKVTLAGGGGGGGGGAGYISSCPDGTYQFDGNSSVKSFCMTQFNIGEHRNNIQKRNQDYIPKCPSCWFYGSNDMSAAWESKCGGAQSGNCCWYAADSEQLTANPETCSSQVGYNACARTVCQYNAARNGCSEFTYVPSGVQSASWSLPSVAQAIYLKEFNGSRISILGGRGAFLCSGNFLSGMDLCDTYVAHCWGSDYDDNANICYPETLWVAEQKMMWLIVRPEIGANGLYGPHDTQVRAAYSARCTLDKTNLFRSLSGAGGSAGAAIENIDITEYIKQAGVNGTIELTAGKAGTGGSGATSNNTKANSGSSGNLSKIIIKDKDKNVVYGIRVSGGKGGFAAQTITPTGTSAKNDSSFPDGATAGCQTTTDGINWTNTACRQYTSIGNEGYAVWGSNSEPYARGGNGANAPLLTATAYGAGGDGTSVSALNGKSPAAVHYGAGGGGGSSIYGYSNIITTGSGGNGAGGFAQIVYNNEFAAAGGGGGGAGSIAVIKDLQVGKAAECTFTIAKGGKGGNVDNDGYDGQASTVKCNTDTRTFIVPGGKGGKKGTPASSISGDNSIPVGGKEGVFVDIHNEINSAIKSYNNSKKVILNGSDGVAGNESIGGRGGTSGSGTKGACGGLYVEEDEAKGICKVSETDNKRINGEGFTYEDIVTPNTKDVQNISNTSYGIAGAGGGGGGWTRDLGSGKGGDGMGGYVCVYWYNEGE